MEAILVLAIVVGVYFLPTINAKYFTKHTNADSILVLNLFLGWTFIGWVIALIWSYKK